MMPVQGQRVRLAAVAWMLVIIMNTLCCHGYHADDEEDEDDWGPHDQSYEDDNYTSSEARLVMDLFHRYQPNKRLARPVLNASHTVRIDFQLQLIQILDFDEKNQMLTTLVWKEYNWYDELLAWDPDDYEGISSIQLPNKKIWTPDIILYNNIGNSDVEQHKSLVVVSSDGKILWMPPVKYQSSCSVDMMEYPFDVQTCTLRLGSWAYDITRLDINFMDGIEAVTLKEYVPNSEWNIVNNNATRRVLSYPCCKYAFVDLIYTLELARQVTFHMRLILVPTMLLSYMTLVVFWIPPFRPDRTAMGMSLFSSFLLLLIIVVESSPPTAAAKLSQYYIIVIFMVALGIVLSILTINISLCTRRFPPILERFIVILRCCVRVEDERSGDQAIALTEPINNRRKFKPLSNTEKWRIFAVILDRIYFFTFLIALVMSLIFVLPRKLLMSNLSI